MLVHQFMAVLEVLVVLGCEFPKKNVPADDLLGPEHIKTVVISLAVLDTAQKNVGGSTHIPSGETCKVPFSALFTCELPKSILDTSFCKKWDFIAGALS